MPDPRDIAKTTHDGASIPSGGPDIGPCQNPEITQGGAPAGPLFGADLPVESVSGGMPATYGGFRPSDYNGPLPAPGSSEGTQKPPTD